MEGKPIALTVYCSTAKVGPVAFKTGDIVEAQVTFMLIPTKDVDWKMIAVLRCLTLLEGKFATVGEGHDRLCNMWMMSKSRT